MQFCTPSIQSCILRERRPRERNIERGKRQRCYRDRDVQSVWAPAPTRAACYLPIIRGPSKRAALCREVNVKEVDMTQVSPHPFHDLAIQFVGELCKCTCDAPTEESHQAA